MMVLGKRYMESSLDDFFTNQTLISPGIKEIKFFFAKFIFIAHVQVVFNRSNAFLTFQHRVCQTIRPCRQNKL